MCSFCRSFAPFLMAGHRFATSHYIETLLEVCGHMLRGILLYTLRRSIDRSTFKPIVSWKTNDRNHVGGLC